MRAWAVKTLTAALLPMVAASSACGDPAVRAADRLVDEQAADGSWPGEEDQAGAIVAGLVNAYQMSRSAAHKAAAENGGDYILASSGGNFYGDGAYALTRLSDLSPDPGDNPWRTEVSAFYAAIETYPHGGGGTAGYISYFATIEPAAAAYYLAHHVVAAHYVDANDRAIWRNALIDHLGHITNDAQYPVMSLAVALWALARTGPLDDTPVDPNAPDGSLWDGVRLADLPPMLLSHQVASGDDAGCFFWRFDHAAPPGGPAYGYTEDTVFGALGLRAAHEAGVADYGAAIADAQDVLAGAVADDGRVFERIWGTGMSYHIYAGEALQAMVRQTVHVDDDNATGVEDGTEQHPFDTIAEAVDVVGQGGTVKVARGTYSGNVVVCGKCVELRGGYLGGIYPGTGDFSDAARDPDPRSNQTTIGGGGLPCEAACGDVAARGSSLTGFRFHNGGAIFHGGVVLRRIVAEHN